MGVICNFVPSETILLKKKMRARGKLKISRFSLFSRHIRNFQNTPRFLYKITKNYQFTLRFWFVFLTIKKSSCFKQKTYRNLDILDVAPVLLVVVVVVVVASHFSCVLLVFVVCFFAFVCSRLHISQNRGKTKIFLNNAILNISSFELKFAQSLNLPCDQFSFFWRFFLCAVLLLF